MPEPQVYVVSGGMGASGEQLARTAFAQFPGNELPIFVVPQLRNADELGRVIERVAATGGVLLHTLVDDLEHALAVFRRGRFTTIDVTAKPIEESASEVEAVVARQSGLEILSRTSF